MSEQIIIPSIGDKIGNRYLIQRELGRGAYGVVYHAKDEQTGVDVALKMLLPQAFLDPDIVTRFTREAEMVSRLSHPNIIKLLDHGQLNGLFYMALEYVDGRTLGELIETDTPLPPMDAQRIIIQILEALTHAHTQGIVHRDLKPENILLQRPSWNQPHEMVKILDFGIAKLILGPNEGKDFKTLTQAGHSLGTPHYMAPEQIAGDVTTNQVDLYAVGTIFYQLLCGRHPFQDANNPAAVMVKHLHYDFPELPDGLEQTKWGRAMRAATVKQPLDRVQDAQAFIDMLKSAEIETQDATVPLDVAKLRASHQGFGVARSGSSQEFAPFGDGSEDDPTVMASRPSADFIESMGQMPQGPPQVRINTQGMTPIPPREPTAPISGFDASQLPGREKSKVATSWITPVIGMLVCVLLISIGLVFIMRKDDKPKQVIVPTTKTVVDLKQPKPTRPNNPLNKQDMGKTDQSSQASENNKDEKQDEKTNKKDAPATNITAKKTTTPKTKKPNKIKKKPAEAKTITIEIKGTPAGASIYFNKAYVGQLPYRKRLPKSDKPIKIKIEKKGYKSKILTVIPKTSQTKTIHLGPGDLGVF